MTLKLYGRAGYMKIGSGEIKASEHRIPREELIRRFLRTPPLAAIVDRHPSLGPDRIFVLLAQHAKGEIGQKLEVEPAWQEAWSEIRKLGDKDLFLPRLVLCTHQLSWQAASMRFLKGWGKTGVPAMVFNYRDPRAQLVSMIRYLAGSSEVDEHPVVQVYRPILQELGSMDRMLSFAITDRDFPYREVYRLCRWMLYHPKVLKLRFEDLVGEEGGGSRERQEEAVERWARFLAVDVPAGKLCQGLFGDTKTFHKGRVDSWRDVFEEHHLREFEREFGDVLVDYGYADD